MQRRFNVGVPRDDRPSKHQPQRVANDRERSDLKFGMSRAFPARVEGPEVLVDGDLHGAPVQEPLLFAVAAAQGDGAEGLAGRGVCRVVRALRAVQPGRADLGTGHGKVSNPRNLATREKGFDLRSKPEAIKRLFKNGNVTMATSPLSPASTGCEKRYVL